MKTATLESKFPLLAVENGCIISKDADITVAYRVELPELFTLTRAEYESMHSTWAKAVKVLPNYSIVHKQDFFIEEGYKPDICKEDLSFLSRSFERHFNERPYLQHTCYLFLTKTTKEHSRTTSSFNALTRGFIIPKEMQDKETVTRFMECCGQFERIVNDSGLLRIIRLTDEEIIGSKNSAGIIEKYFFHVAGRCYLLAGSVTRCRGNEGGRQLPVPSYAFRSGRPAVERVNRQPV